MKHNFFASFIGTVTLMCIFCSCGNSGKPQVDEQAIKDSIQNAVMDSIRNAEVENAKNDSLEAFNKSHSPEMIQKRVKEMFRKDEFFSKDYKSTSKKLQESLTNLNVMKIMMSCYIWFSRTGIGLLMTYPIVLPSLLKTI